MPIWVLVNNMPTTSTALHQSDDTMSRRKEKNKTTQNMLLWFMEMKRNMQLGRWSRWILGEVEKVELLLSKKVNKLKESCHRMKGR